MVNMSFEKIAPGGEHAGARRTVLGLIRLHQDILDRIDSGEKFFNGKKEVTTVMWSKSLDEIEQCRKVLLAMDRMNAGELKEAYKLLGEIQEHIPHTH